MLHLAHVEALKLKRNIPFLVLIALFVASMIGVNHVAAEIASDNNGARMLIPFTFPGIWKTVAYISSYLLVIPALVIIMHTCAEHTYRTHRQNVIDGLSRDQYITAKLLLVLALALFSTLLVFLVASLIGIFSGSSFSLVGVKNILYFFLHAAMFLSFALLLALLLKRSAIAMGILIIYWSVIENIAERYLCKVTSLGQLLPLASSEHLLDLDAHQFFAPKHVSMSTTAFLAATVAYILLCYLACYYHYRKRDL